MGRWEPGVPQPEGKWLGKDYPKRRHEAQGEGRDPGPGPQTRGNARAKAAHQAEMSAVSKGEGKGETRGGAHRADPVEPCGPGQRLYVS